MNLKQILCLTAIAAVSTQAFALEIYHGRVTSEKTWSTDGSKVTFAKKALRARANTGLPQEQALNVGMMNTTGKVGEPVTLVGTHSIYITNDTATVQTYYYDISVCVLMDAHTAHCVYQGKNLELDPSGYFYVDDEPQMTLTFNAPGNYQSTATTWIRGSGNSTGYMNAISNVTIS